MVDIIKDALKGFVLEGFKSIAKGIILNSYWICLMICLISVLMYVGGCKKAGKTISITFIIYVLLQALRTVIE